MSKGAGFETGLTVRPLQSPVYPVSWNRRLRPSHPTKVPTNMERSRAITQTGIHTDFRRFSKVMILVSWWGFERVRTGPQPSALCMIVHRARWCLPSSIGQQTPDNRRWQGHTKPLIIPNLDRHLLNSVNYCSSFSCALVSMSNPVNNVGQLPEVPRVLSIK
jgi:hypothetical protein